MKSLDFADKIIQAYERARSPTYASTKLIRGESRSVASEIEDLLGLHLVENNPRIDKIYINQPLRFTGDSGKPIKPDLVIVRGGVIRALVDLKMDIGYKRKAIQATFRNSSDRIEEIKKSPEVTFKIGKGRRSSRNVSFQVSKELKFHFLCVSSGNCSKALFSEAECAAGKLLNITFSTLVRGAHPNDHERTVSERLEICGPQIECSLPQFCNLVGEAVA